MRKRPMYLVLLLAIILSMIYLAAEDSSSAASYPDGLTGEAAGTVYKKDKNSFYLKHTSFTAESETVPVENLKVYSENPRDIKIGNRVLVSGTIYSFQEPRNPGEFDSKAYYLAMRIPCYFYEEYSEVLDESFHPYLEWLETIKARTESVFFHSMKEENAAVMTGMLLGEKGYIPQEIKDLYQRGGISHLLSISGLHVSIIAYGVYQFLRKTGLGFLSCAILASALAVSFGFLTGWSISTVRAVLMFLMSMGAKASGRSYDMGTGMSMAAVIILMTRPRMLTQAGFLLSFGAVASLTLLLPVIENSFSAVKKKWAASLLVTLTVNISLLPVILYFYYEVPLYSTFINILLIPLAAFLLFLGIIGAVLGFIYLPASGIPLFLCELILGLYKSVCSLAENLPYNVLVFGKPGLGQICFYYICLAVIAAGLHFKKKKVLLSWFAAVFVLTIRVKPEFRTVMLDVGQGESIFMEASDGTVFLMDGGSTDIKSVGTYRILPFLKSEGVRKIEYIFISHTDEDHINGIMELLEYAGGKGPEIGTLILPQLSERDESYHEMEQRAVRKGISLRYMAQNMVIQKGNTVIKCLYPRKGAQYASKNDSSLVLEVYYKNFSMLLTGDLESEGEEELLRDRKFGTYHILNVAHHGSKNSTASEFLEWVQPSYALISCGKNNRYGHPHSDLTERLEESSCRGIFQTPETGAVTVILNGKEYEIKSFLGI